MRHHRCLWTRIKWRLFGKALRNRDLARHLKEAAHMNSWDMQLYFRNVAYRQARRWG